MLRISIIICIHRESKRRNLRTEHLELEGGIDLGVRLRGEPWHSSGLGFRV